MSVTRDQVARIVGNSSGIAFVLLKMLADELVSAEYDRVERMWHLTFVDDQAALMWRLRWL